MGGNHHFLKNASNTKGYCNADVDKCTMHQLKEQMLVHYDILYETTAVFLVATLRNKI